MKTEVARDFFHADHRCVVLRIGFPLDDVLKMQDIGVTLLNSYWYTGYVAVGPESPLHGVGYSVEWPALVNGKYVPADPVAVVRLLEELKKGKTGKRGIITLFCFDGKTISLDILCDVHGSLTYSSGGPGEKYPVKTDNLWWFGFDCNHCDDHPDTHDADYTVMECRSLAEQLDHIEGELTFAAEVGARLDKLAEEERDA